MGRRKGGKRGTLHSTHPAVFPLFTQPYTRTTPKVFFYKLVRRLWQAFSSFFQAPQIKLLRIQGIYKRKALRSFLIKFSMARTHRETVCSTYFVYLFFHSRTSFGVANSCVLSRVCTYIKRYSFTFLYNVRFTFLWKRTKSCELFSFDVVFNFFFYCSENAVKKINDRER